jgi:TPP-dependent pyruvate/acetoin dehydrogenase alpha subunit
MSQATAAPPELARRLYYGLLLIQRVETRIAEEYHLYEMRCPTHLYLGQEAVATGVCAALRREDLIFPYYRSHGWYLAKGGDLNAMFAELMGRITGCSKGWGGSMHLIDLEAGVMGTSAIVGGMISQAAGGALALRMKGSDAITMVPFGDGAIEEGVFHETLNFASLRKLPMFFVCENNTYATNTHIRERQAQTDIYRHAAQYAVPGVLVDGNDVVAVHAAATEAAARARRGEGPTLIECRTYRLLEHCGPNEDLDIGYRTLEEIEHWQAHGALQKAQGLVTEADARAMREEIEARIDAAFAYARSSPFPTELFGGEAAP